jgi:hypothetical protein
MASTENEKPINTALAARLVKVSRRTLYNWMAWGWLPWTRSTGAYGSRLVKLSDIYAIRPHLHPDYQGDDDAQHA